MALRPYYITVAEAKAATTQYGEISRVEWKGQYVYDRKYHWHIEGLSGRYIIHYIDHRGNDDVVEVGGSGWNTCYNRIPNISRTLIDNHGQTYRIQISGQYLRDDTQYLMADRVGFPSSLPHSVIDFIKTNNVIPLCTELSELKCGSEKLQNDLLKTTEAVVTLERESKEKDDRITALEMRVKELEALEAKVKALEAQLEFNSIPHIHIIAAPKPNTTATDLLELEDFFGVSDSKHCIGNIPEFVHDE